MEHLKQRRKQVECVDPKSAALLRAGLNRYAAYSGEDTEDTC